MFLTTRTSTILHGNAPPLIKTFFPSGRLAIPIPQYPIL
nr:MAG TPA: hypothetical protein [Bacteriophage sp.]DAW75806.1 MAG TPA: hypothetical protein [Crassvirales sp.]